EDLLLGGRWVRRDDAVMTGRTQVDAVDLARIPCHVQPLGEIRLDDNCAGRSGEVAQRLGGSVAVESDQSRAVQNDHLAPGDLLEAALDGCGSARVRASRPHP